MARREEVQFTPPPVIDPAVTGPMMDPSARRYQQQMEERRYGAPVGGEHVPIPRLDASQNDGMSMSDNARVQRQPMIGSQMPGGGIFGDPAAAQAAAPAKLNLFPADLLPEAAKSDPMFQQGMGSMNASNQPHLAQKYGVIRNGQFIPAQMLSTGRAGLKSETVEGLKQLAEFQKTREKVESGEQAIEDQAAEGPAGAGARLAGGDAAASTQADRKKMQEQINELDDFDYHTYREMMMKDILNNEEQRRVIEERLKADGSELSITDLVTTGYVPQIVHVVPGKFFPEFQSMTAEEDLALKRLIAMEAKELNISDKYLLDKYSMMSVAVGLRSINKIPLPDHKDKQGKFDDAAFWQKFNHVVKYPFHMIASLGVQYFWFDIRVRKLFVAEKVKNG